MPQHEAVLREDRREMSEVRRGDRDQENEKGPPLLWMREQSDLRFYVLAEAFQQAVSEVRKLHGRKREKPGLLRPGVRIC